MKAKLEQEVSRETRSILLDKLLQDYVLTAGDIAEAVELYYDAQNLRIRYANRERTEGVSPLKEWFDYWLTLGEKVLRSKLKKWVESDESPLEARWAYEQTGIGPIIAAGLAAHIDVAKADTVSALWKFAGLAPGFDRKVKGQKLAFNSRLKVLCWKLSDSFVKVSGKEDATYGKLYNEYKAEEIRKNESGLYKEAAKRELEIKKFKQEDSVTKQRLKAGKLSDAHLHARAKRKTAKIFLSHYYVVGREVRGLSVRSPYAQQILNHDGIIEPIR